MTEPADTTSAVPSESAAPGDAPLADAAANTAMLLEFLHTNDAPCPLCKYNLRNLVTPRCPECGRDIKLTVGLVEQNIRWYIVLLVAALLPVGMGILCWVVLFREGMTMYRFASFWENLAYVGCQASPIPALLVLLLRRRFLRLDPVFQRGLALLAAEPLILYGILICKVR